MKFKEALKELREKTKKRNFDQTLDLILNLKSFDIKKDAVGIVVSLPNTYKKVKVCAFLESSIKSDVLERVISKNEIDKFDLKEMKKMSKEMDFFIANAKLMPLVAKKFGKVLGAIGKMPDPKIGGVVSQESTEAIQNAVNKLKNIVKTRTKEKSIKLAVGKESKTDEELIQNLERVFKDIVEKLPKKELNVKNVMLKFTMGPAIQVKK
ncbi:MAG: hypothetical protein JSW08_03150 [archaeon]|nr:MAG: hypothetical protein JSW08_03150 [archaeon]